jgi:hypothetical protein
LSGHSSGSVFARCGCRNRHGRRRGASCSRLGEAGHGSWYFSTELPRYADGGRRRLRRGGYLTCEAAAAARDRLSVPVLGDPRDGVYTVVEWLETWVETRARLRDSTRPESGSRRCEAGPERGQEPARWRWRPQAQRSRTSRDHRLTFRHPRTRPMMAWSHHARTTRGPGPRQPGAPAGPSACPERETKTHRSTAGPTWDPPWSHQTSDTAEQALKGPAQTGCAARDLNPEPAD